MLNILQEYNGSDREATIPWLDKMELVAEMTGIDPLEVGISKLKGLSLADISTFHKEEGLLWHKFRQSLIEQYLNVLYIPDAMLVYSKVSQQEYESTTRYLVRAKVLLEQIHRTSKLSEISGYGMDNLSLIQGLWENHIRKQVAREQESWCTMEDVFNSINHVTMMEERSKTYHQPEYDSMSQVSIERVHEVSMPNRCVKPRSSQPYKTHSSPHYNPQTRSTFRNKHKPHNSQHNRDQGRLQYHCMPTNLKCYYCQVDRLLKECNKFTKDKTKYKLKSADMFRKCKDQVIQQAKKENVSINEAMFTMVQELTYSVEEAEQLLGNMCFSDT